MSSSREKYTDPQEHLSPADLIAYKEEWMTDAEMHRVELHALDCALCNDALEGVDLVENKVLLSSLEDLKGRLSGRVNQEPQSHNTWKWGIAATILLLFSASVFFILNVFQTENTDITTKDTDEWIPTLSPIPLEVDTVKVPERPQISILSSPEAIKNNSLTKEQTTTNKADDQPILESRDIDQVVFEDEQNAEVVREVTEVLEEVVMEDLFFEEREKESPYRYALSDNMRTSEVESAKKVMGIRGMSSAPPQANFSGNNYLTGQVTDSDGEPIPGVNVWVKGSNQATITDINGAYVMEKPPAGSELLFSFVGFQSKEGKVTDTTTRLMAMLEPDLASLSEVVVTGYGTRRKREITSTSVDSPSPVKGYRKYNKYLRDNINHLAKSKETEVEGSVIISFDVEADGSLSNFEVVASGGDELDKKAIQLIKEGPAWEPAVREGQKVKGKVLLPIPLQ